MSDDVVERIRSLSRTVQELPIPDLDPPMSDTEGATPPKPFVGYFTMLTVHEQREIIGSIPGDSPEALARIMWQKLLDENGRRVFDGMSFPEFARIMPSAISIGVGTAIFARTPTPEQARGN